MRVALCELIWCAIPSWPSCVKPLQKNKVYGKLKTWLSRICADGSSDVSHLSSPSSSSSVSQRHSCYYWNFKTICFLICGTLGRTSQSDDGTFPPVAFRKEWYLTCDGQMSQRGGLDQTHNFLSEEAVQRNFLPNGFLLSEFFPLRLSTIVGSEEWKRAKGSSSEQSKTSLMTLQMAGMVNKTHMRGRNTGQALRWDPFTGADDSSLLVYD